MAYNHEGYRDKAPRSFEDKRNDRDKTGNMGTGTLPTGYLSNGYFRDDGKCDIRYVGVFAEKIAAELSTDKETAKSKIRAYFDEVANIKTEMERKYITEDEAMKRLIKLKSRVANRMSKKTASKLFGQFIGKNVDTVTETEAGFKKNLNEFVDHFEAVVGFTVDK